MTFGRVLRNVFSCVWLATSAAVAQPPTMRARTPTCAACRIVLVKDLALDTVNAAATVSRQPIHASRSPQGRIAVVPGSSIEPVLLFDAGGKFLTPIGRKGSGPNEYVRTVAAHWLDADRLNIYDLASARVTTVNAAGRLVGTAPFHANSALLRPLDRGAHLVVNAFGGGRFAVYDSGALDGRTFGTIPEERPTRVQLSNVRRGQFWSVLSRSYRLDAWSVAGRHLATIERAAPWLSRNMPYSDGTFGLAPTAYSQDLRVDSLGRIWVLTTVASAGWRNGLGSPVKVNGRDRYPDRNMEKLFDTIIDVFDGTSFQLLTSHRVPGFFMVFLSDEHVLRQREGDDGSQVLEVWRVRMESEL
ncbi:MAG: 6-bladed beta-propeller [Gemmatimonadota bacterium]